MKESNSSHSLHMDGDVVTYKGQEYELVNTPESLQEWANLTQSTSVIVIDVETIPKHPKSKPGRACPHSAWDDLAGVAIAVRCPRGIRACYIPRTHKGTNCISPDKLRAFLMDSVLGTEGRVLVNHNIAYDLGILHRFLSRAVDVPVDDTMVMYRLLWPDRKFYPADLDSLAKKILEYDTLHYSDVVIRGNHQDITEAQISDVTAYAGEDTVQTGLLCRKLLGELSNPLHRGQIKNLYIHIERPLIPVVVGMNTTGVLVNEERAVEFHKHLEAGKKALQEEINQEAGKEININSPKQLCAFLYDDRGNAITRRTNKGAPSVDSKTLNAIAIDDPVAALIKEAKEYDKHSGMLKGLLGEINPETGRVHPQFQQMGTDTGRFSCKEPNFQQIPKKGALGDAFRKLLVPRDGYMIVSADYSQIEYRILVAMSGDENLIRAYRDGVDFHVKTASTILGKDVEDVTKQERAIGKKINFSVIYGQGPLGVAAELKIPMNQAKKFISQYWDKLPSVREFDHRVSREAYHQGGVYSFFGRWRSLPDIRYGQHSVRDNRYQRAKRQAMNFVIQGSAADILKMAMLLVHNHISAHFRDSAVMIMTVHDELVFEVREDVVDDFKSQLREVMVNAVELSAEAGFPLPNGNLCVPLQVDVGHGPSWGDLE